MYKRTHSEEQSWDGSATFDMNHGQKAGQVTFSGSSKEKSGKDRVVNFFVKF